LPLDLPAGKFLTKNLQTYVPNNNEFHKYLQILTNFLSSTDQDKNLFIELKKQQHFLSTNCDVVTFS
jgi:hypothetical protein